METFRVLVVDDELGIRVGVTRVLRNFMVQLPEIESEVDFSVEPAETAEQALEIIKTNPPHILLLDNKLPGMSGMEALERISTMNLDMHTIVITAYASIETAVRATKHGAYDFLPKPFTPADLKSTIRKVAKQLVVQRRAKELAAEKKKVRFEFISMLAHELKAPLNAVDGYLKILRDRSAGDDQAAYQQFVERCLVRNEYMRKMINDLLDLTRIESGQRSREITDLDLAAVTESAIQTVLPEAEERGVTIALSAERPVALRADRAEMEIILNNLLSNAVKYNRPDGRVEVSVKRVSDQVVVAVSDTGIGMSTDECAKIFHDFVRIKNAKTDGILGSGLGLSTVKKLAQIYGGNVSVSSEPGQGSTFTAVLKDVTPEGTLPESSPLPS